MKITRRDYQAYVEAEKYGVDEQFSIEVMIGRSGLTEEQVREIRNNREQYRREFGC